MTQERKETPLDTALRLATNDPGSRPDFYKILLEASVFVIGYSEHPQAGKRMLDGRESVTIENWFRDDKTPIIPFFSSLESLQKAITEDVRYLEIPAKVLFEMTKGASLVLNPRLEYGKEFLPDEIDALLSNGVTRVPEQRITTEATQVLLGQPAKYPEKMVAALVSLFSKRPNVKAAYLVLMHDPSRDDKPHLVVGVDADHEIESIIREAGTVAGDTSPNGESVDLYRIEPDDQGGLSQYFICEVTPFYMRKESGKSKPPQPGGWLSKLWRKRD